MHTMKRTRSEASVKEEALVPDFDATQSEGLAKALHVLENGDAKDLAGAPLCNDILIRARLSRLPPSYEEEEREEEDGDAGGGKAGKSREEP